MFYGAYTLNGKRHSAVYRTMSEWIRETWSPETRNITYFNFAFRGRTYCQKQQSLCKVLNEWAAFSADIDIAPSEMALINRWIVRNARQYGLYRLLPEIGINAK